MGDGPLIPYDFSRAEEEACQAALFWGLRPPFREGHNRRRALDVEAGNSGAGARILVGFDELVQIDSWFNGPGVIPGDILRPSPSWGLFDVVLCKKYLYQLHDEESQVAVQNMYNLLYPGGLLLLCEAWRIPGAEFCGARVPEPLFLKDRLVRDEPVPGSGNPIVGIKLYQKDPV